MSMTLTHTNKNLQTEVNVLGSILVNPSKMDDVVSLINEEDFAIPAHGLIWRGLKYLYQKNEAIDVVSLTTLLRQFGRLEEVGGTEYLAKIHGSVPSAESAGFYAKILRSSSLKRRAHEKLEEAKNMVESSLFDDDDEEFLSKIEQKVLEIRPENFSTMKHVEAYEEAYFNHFEEEEETILTGFRNFDEWMGGIGRGWLYILAGRPSVGKTAKMLQTALGIAGSNVGPVLVWSQEMQTTPLLNRIMANMAGVPAMGIRKKKLDENQKKRIREAFQRLKRLPLHIEDSKGVTIEQVKATARQFHRKHGRLGAIFVDYLTIMKINQKSNQRWDQAVGDVTRNAKLLAMELNCPFIMLAQMNREGEGKKPVLTNLRDSGDIEQDADVVEFLWKNPDDPTRTDGEIIESVIAKGRDIGTNEFKFLFKSWFQRFEEL